MNHRDQTRAILILTSWMLLGCVAAVLPEVQRMEIRRQLRDGFAPIARFVGTLPIETLLSNFRGNTSNSISDKNEKNSEVSEDVSRLERQILALKSLLNDQNQKLPAETSQSLFQPRLIEARRMSGSHEERWRSGAWIDAGTSRNVREQDWILKAEQPLLDLGADAKIHPDDLVLAGRAIVGQVSAVGRWSSSYRSVTDPEFRCPVQILKTDKASQSGGIPVGSLHGTGDKLCELKYIENTAPVSQGDYVVLNDPEQTWEQPLVLGRVVRAEVKTNSPFWEIDVEPISDSERSRQVLILSQQISPERIAAMPKE